MKTNKYCLILLLLISISYSCIEKKGESKDLYAGMDDKTKTRMQQYYRQGKKLYLTHCASCHQIDGKGLASLYPPLSGADYLMKDPVKVACIIKKGISGEIVVNGTKYNQPMPSLDYLTNIEIAEIITYISNSWENKSTLHEVKTVESITKGCL